MGRLILRTSVTSGSGGGSSPASGDSNVSFAGSDVQVINPALPSILDLRQDYTQAPRNTALWLGGVERLATATYVSGGGYYRQGCMRFVPGRFISDPEGNPRGDHPFGIGQILGFGELQVVTIGLLWRHGPTLLLESDGIKSLVVLREGSGGQDERPMIIPKGAWAGGGTVVLPPCDGTECNARSTYGAPTGEDNSYNDPPIALPDIQEAWENDVHVYTEARIDLTASPYNTMHTASWFSDSSELGTNILRKYLWRDTGGYMPGIDIIGYANSIDDPTSDCWLDLERIEIHPNVLGVGPPAGFPGSTR